MKSRKRTWIVLGIAIALAVSAFVKREDILTAWSIRKARQSLQAHRSDAARVFIEEVLTANPDHPEAHFLMARMYRRKGMYPDFSRHLKRAMDLGYSTDSLQLEQRMAMAQEGRVSEVEAELVKAMDGTQRDSDICEAMVTGYFVSYQFNKGRSLLDAWRGDFPDEPQIYFLEAKFEEYRDEMSSAIRNYRKVLRLDPGRWDARLELARALGEEHKYDEAEELLAQCLDNEPASMKVLSAQAHVFTEQAKVDPARETWEKVLQLDDGHVEARIALARIAMEADNPRKAKRLIESVVRGDRRNSRARFILASALQATGQTEAATAHREEIERYQRIQDRLKSLRTEFRMRSTPEMRFEYATLLLEIETDAGIGALLGFVAEHPDHIGAHQLLRDQYKANGDGERYEYHQRELRRLGADETPTETTNQPVEQISE